MSATEASVIECSVEKTHAWLTELSEELGVEDDNYSYRVLRGVLHALRDRLSVDVMAQLAAQLPTLIRGIYYESWDPSHLPTRAHEVDAFLERVVHEAHLESEIEASFAVSAVMRVLQAHLTPGTMDAARAVLPESLRIVVMV